MRNAAHPCHRQGGGRAGHCRTRDGGQAHPCHRQGGGRVHRCRTRDGGQPSCWSCGARHTSGHSWNPPAPPDQSACSLPDAPGGQSRSPADVPGDCQTNCWMPDMQACCRSAAASRALDTPGGRCLWRGAHPMRAVRTQRVFPLPAWVRRPQVRQFPVWRRQVRAACWQAQGIPTASHPSRQREPRLFPRGIPVCRQTLEWG